ncbi:MAG: DUF3604 domain-containing protein [Myxococcota bacterium]
MKRFLLLGSLAILGLLAVLYAAGRGWLGETLHAGTPLAQPRVPGPASETEGAKRVLFGDFHVHTGFSADAYTLSLPLTGGSGSHTVADACDFARFCAGLDFWSVNDHAEGASPRRWRETVETVRQCDAVGRDASGASDLVSFLGWEWSHMGTTPENHYGHRNVVLRDLEDASIPTRPIGADSPAQYFQSAPALVRGVLPLITGEPAYLRYATALEETEATPRCADGVPVRELPSDCRELTATPAGLFAKLRDWGHAALVIPHGMTWGMYTPPGSNWEKQLSPEQHDPVLQRLVEVYSGHGNVEPYRDWRGVTVDADGVRRCPPPRDDYLPACWQAGEIIRRRCGDAGLAEETCEARAADARRHFVEGAAGLGHLAVPSASAEEWGDAGQCRDCFSPAFSYRPGSSAQALLGLSRSEGDAPPQRFRLGFIASSDNHTARPGTGYKELLRTRMSDARMARVKLPIGAPEFDPAPEARPADPGDVAPSEWIERERAGSFYFTGGLVAVHATRRHREAIWEALETRETYATSGPRILLWFDAIDANASGGRAPMGSHLTMDREPTFEVRAVGSHEQAPGCRAGTEERVGADRLARLCGGECFHPTDTRRPIVRIEVIRVRPQRTADEPLADLIEDPWRSFACDGDLEGCVVRFSDPEFVAGQRDTTYYVRAIEVASPAVNGGTLRCEPGDAGPCTQMQPCDPWAPESEDCLAPVEERAWSSPIFVDWRAPDAAPAEIARAP